MDLPAGYMDCVLRIDTRSLGWHVMLDRVLKSIDGINYKINGEKGAVQITGRLNPRQLMKTLQEVGLHADISPSESEYREMMRHGYGSYGYDPYGGYNPYGYPPPPHHHPQPNWHHIHDNYPHYLHYYQHYPQYHPQAEAQFFPQPPPQPVGFRNGDPEWCSIM
ncbi:hypothetical protein COLO4_09772 [Corchorus olitorius]|uniref:HMA domain-containing protein n=1 Tax=Corchorus olitorius TaxID=93759 RepID=A0A1R3KBA7_9ROSI|nr:hypothetical protein COLO4_09772 [Corchorus olitorius]